MVLFYALFIIPFVSYFYYSNRTIGSEKKDKVTLLIFFFILFLLLSLRANSVGNDTLNYQYFYQKYRVMSWSEMFSDYTEIGFRIFTKIIATIVPDNFNFYLTALALIEIVPITYFYCKKINHSPIAMVLFTNLVNFIVLFSALRQSVAVSFGILAYSFLEDKKWVRFAISAILAISFHTSDSLYCFSSFFTISISNRNHFITLPRY